MWGNHLAKSVEKILKKDAANNAIYSDSSILSMKTYKHAKMVEQNVKNRNFIRRQLLII